jgi:hypothetical protein
MDGSSMIPLLLTMIVFLLASLLLVAPYPRAQSGLAVLAHDGGHD